MILIRVYLLWGLIHHKNLIIFSIKNKTMSLVIFLFKGNYLIIYRYWRMEVFI